MQNSARRVNTFFYAICSGLQGAYLAYLRQLSSSQIGEPAPDQAFDVGARALFKRNIQKKASTRVVYRKVMDVVADMRVWI